jgi:plasmid maintenance system antidote protein VapI
LRAAMDVLKEAAKPFPMGKAPAPKKRRREPVKPRTLFLGQWLAVLGRKPGEVAKAIGCNEGYMSLLVSGKQKRNPSTELILDLSDELGVSVNALYSPPPARDVAGEAGKLSPRQWAAFLEVLAMRPSRNPQD